MTNEYPPISPAALVAPEHRGRRLRYLALALAVNCSIWGIALFLLKDSPREYTSRWSMMFLGRSPQSSKNPGIDSASPEAAADLADVKAGYQVIATADNVCKAAAAKLGMTTEQFGKPQVESSVGAGLITFSITGLTGGTAQKKAYALNEAFQDQLNQLRLRQAEDQESGFENSLSIAQKKLEAAQLRLSDYKVKAGLTSKDQIDQLASNIETLRRLRAEAAASQQDANVRSQQLAIDLDMTSKLASEAFMLRSDLLFQQYLREYSEATASLTNVSTKFGPNHPVMIRETARRAAAQAALLERGKLLLGHSVDPAAIARINLGSTTQSATSRESLFKDVVTSNLERQGLAARVMELDRQLAQLEQRLSILAQRNSTLDALNRDMQIAEAVFSSKLASLDPKKADVFGSYPPVQMVADPTLPTTSIIPRQKPYFMAAAMISFLSTVGLVLLYGRKTPYGEKWLQQHNISGII